ncbi:clostripain-related cysteine peptidase [Hyunsoonleella aestuarii]|nr:clostripain-related cysteine peptidase [Hyunsoonleella aestuarii]
MKHIFISLIVLMFVVKDTFSQTKKEWTIMHYAVGSNSSEIDLLSDIEEMKQGKRSNEYKLITLIDRIEGFSEDSVTLDGNFTDTRLYEINYETYKRLDGKEFFPQIKANRLFEGNMAEALTLKKFVQYCKKYYPANNYMLVLRSHGNGIGMCPDAEDGKMDRLYPGEMSYVLTNEESVDILGLDVCSMAGLENLYEWRPNNNSFSADYVLASSPLSGAWAYDAILDRLSDNENNKLDLDSNFFDGGIERNINPNNMTPLDFSKLIIEEIYDNQGWASWGLLDNTKIENVKTKVDEASKLLAHENKDSINAIIKNTLGYYHNTNSDIEIAQLTFPYIDAYHFWIQIADNVFFSKETRLKANEVCISLDNLVLNSYYGQGYLPETNNFLNGKNGVYQIIPQGDNVFSQSGRTFWNHCGWFHPDNRSSNENSYGQYDWCIDGAIRANNQVDNFFELLDYLFDESNEESGGVNNYQW